MPFRMEKMNTQKPTEAAVITKLIASALCVNPPESFQVGRADPIWTVYRPEAHKILTALGAAGYAIVPREPTEATIRAVDVQAHVHWPNSRKMAAAMYDTIIAEAEKGK